MAAVKVPHPAAVAVERATIVWIRCLLQIRCPMQIGIIVENALNWADDPVHE